MPAAFFFGQNINGSVELRVRRDGSGLCDDLTPFHFLALGSSQKDADVIACASLIQRFTEHFHAGANGFKGRANPDDLHFVTGANDPAINPAGHHCSAAGNRKHIPYGHQEGLVQDTNRLGNVLVNGIHQFEDGLDIRIVFIIALERLERRSTNDRKFIPGKFVCRKQLSQLQFHEVKQLRVVDQVDFIHVDDDIGNLNLSCKEDVLPGLGHGAVGCGNNQNGAVHMRRSGNHVFDIVRVTGTIHMGIMPLGSLILHVADVDGHASFLFFGGIVDGVKRPEFSQPFLGQVFGDRGRQCGFSMIHMPNRPDIEMRLCPFKFFLSHFFLPP